MFEKTLFGRIFRDIRLFDGHKDLYPQQLQDYSQYKVSEYKKTQTDLIWVNIISIGILHGVAIYGLIAFLVGYERIYWSTILWGFFQGILAGLGVTAGAHRLFSHKAYKAKPPLKIFLLYCFTLAGQNSVYDWVRDHRVHHKFSETDADPHNANRGFFFAHVGWLMMRKHPDVINKGKTVDMSDITNDPIIAFHTKYFILIKIVVGFLIPTLVPIICWGETARASILLMDVVRYTIVLNSTWSVNSAAHIWGQKPYDKRIQPTENRAVSIFSLGEGWHNYHHVFPWDYRASELGPHSSITTNFIDFAAKLGLAYDRKEPSKTIILNTIKKYGDGTWTLHLHSPPLHPEDCSKSEDYDNDSNCIEPCSENVAGL